MRALACVTLVRAQHQRRQTDLDQFAEHIDPRLQHLRWCVTGQINNMWCWCPHTHLECLQAKTRKIWEIEARTSDPKFSIMTCCDSQKERWVVVAVFVHVPFVGCTCVVSTIPSRESSFIIWNNRTCTRGQQLKTENGNIFADNATIRIATQRRGQARRGRDTLKVRSTHDDIFDPRGEDLHDYAVRLGLSVRQRDASLYRCANTLVLKRARACWLWPCRLDDNLPG